jgi:hypothetical protein
MRQYLSVCLSLLRSKNDSHLVAPSGHRESEMSMGIAKMLRSWLNDRTHPLTMNDSASPTPERLMQLAWSFAPPLIIETAVQHGVFDDSTRDPGARQSSRQKPALQSAV